MAQGSMAGVVELLLKALDPTEGLQFAPIGFPKDVATGHFIGRLRNLVEKQQEVEKNRLESKPKSFIMSYLWPSGSCQTSSNIDQY